MENSNLQKEISELVDKYFTERVKSLSKFCNSNFIRGALNNRIGTYFPKSLLNDILLKKGFLYEIESDNDYYFNISLKDIRILSNSQAILTRLAEKDNWTIYDYIKLHKF